MTEVDELYQATIVDHDRTPRNWGSLNDATHTATVDNPLCGDVVTVQVQIIDGVIHDIACEGRGCALSRAAASIMSTMVRDRDPEAVRRLTMAFEHLVHGAPDAAIEASAAAELGELCSFVGVRRFRSRRMCATLPFRALALALDIT